MTEPGKGKIHARDRDTYEVAIVSEKTHISVLDIFSYFVFVPEGRLGHHNVPPKPNEKMRKRHNNRY